MRKPTTFAMLMAVAGLVALAAAPVSANHVLPKSQCIPTFDHSVLPAYTLLGDTTTVTVRFSAVCAGREPAMHVVLALGSPQSMTDEEQRDGRAAAQDLAEHIATVEPNARIGVAGWHGAVACNVTTDLSVVLRCLDRALDPRGADRDQPPEGVLAAAGALFRRAHLQDPLSDPRQIVILIATSPDARECPAWQREAASIRASGVLAITLCVERNCAARCIGKLATSRRYAFDLDNFAHMYDMFQRIRGLLSGAAGTVSPPGTSDTIAIGLRSIALVYPLPAAAAYVPASLSPLAPPSAGAYDAVAHQVSWRTNYVPKDGVTITFGIRLLESGAVETGAGAAVHAVDPYNLPFDVDLVPQAIWVFGSR